MGRKSRAAAQLRAIETRQTKVDRAVARVDGWRNILTGLGDPTRDKRLAHHVVVKKLEYADCEAYYRGSDIGARIVEEVPNEMTREGFDVLVQDDKEASEATEQKLEEIEAVPRIYEALCWKRAFGGAGIILGVDDGVADIAQPLNMKGIKSLEWLSVLDARELVPWTFYIDPLSPKYGQPATYKIMPYHVGIGPGGVAPEERGRNQYSAQWQEIHESRILRFTGVVVNRYQMRETWGWGESIFVRVQDALRDFDASYSGAAALVQDFSQAVFKIKGLADLLASKQDDVVMQRLSLIQLQRSVLRAVLLDAGDDDGSGGEDFERKPTPVTGLCDILDRMALRLAASVDMPVTRLLGQQPAGLNATGDNDLRRWYDQVHALQRRDLLPHLKRLLRVLFLAKNGPTKGKEPDRWTVRFRPLWKLDALQEATRRKTIMETDTGYVDRQVIAPEEVASSRFGGDDFGEEIQLDSEIRDRMAEQSEQDDANEAAMTEHRLAQAEARTRMAQAAAAAAPNEGPASDSNPVGAK